MNASLKNLRILATRPGHQAHSLSSPLRELGAEVIELPLITIGAPPSWNAFDRAFERAGDYIWVIFTSANAVEATLTRLRETGCGPGVLEQMRIASIGPATTNILQANGLTVEFEPGSFVAESLVSEFPGYPAEMNGVRILWPKADIGRTYIKDKMESAGAAVDAVYCYRTTGPEHPREAAYELRQMLLKGEIDIITLTSSETVRSFHRLVTANGASINEFRNSVRIAVIGPETARTADELIGGADILAREYNIAGLVRAVVEAAPVASAHRSKN